MNVRRAKVSDNTMAMSENGIAFFLSSLSRIGKDWISLTHTHVGVVVVFFFFFFFFFYRGCGGFFSLSFSFSF